MDRRCFPLCILKANASDRLQGLMRREMSVYPSGDERRKTASYDTRHHRLRILWRSILIPI